jgi:uncharacterized SAM-binding protein YcdF (DUF218 family)
VRPDGRPSPALQRRVKAAIELPFPEVPLLFSGGGNPSEAWVASDYARSLGVSSSRILLEENATSTWENAVFSAKVLKEKGVGPRRILVVSDPVHLLRCFLVFRREFEEVELWAAPSRNPAKLAMREVLVLVLYGVQGRLF